LIWAAGVLTMFFAPLFVVISVWLYTLVFAFTALWFAHYGLAALQAYRAEQPIEPQPQTPGAGPPASPALLPG
jgi:hypothetical protein